MTQAGQQVDQGGLATAGWAEHHPGLAFGDLPVEVAVYLVRPRVAEAEIRDLNHAFLIPSPYRRGVDMPSGMSRR
jgi:hypothetical protein